MKSGFPASWSLAFVLAAASTAIAFAGCGSSTSTDDSSTGDDSGADGSAHFGSCSLVGTACTSNGDCCSASCDTSTKICVKPIGACKAAGTSCAAPNECCTFVCSSGACGANLCISDHQACTANDACCSGKCAAIGDGGTMECVPLNTTCSTSGNACTTNGECCSKLCTNGVCSAQASFCTQSSDACSTDTECCGGICTKASGAVLGLCVAPSVPGGTQCGVAGEVCGAGADGGTLATDGGPPPCGGTCCSRACAPYGPTGVFVCQPPSGCRPTGEVCRSNADCCGSPGMPGGNGSVVCSKANASDAIGRCDNGQACRPNGAVCKLATSSCNAENNCCAGNVNKNALVCQQDLLGIPRCTDVGSCADAGSLAGKACASSADCCGLPCVPNPTAGGAPFVCGGTCVSSGGACTTNADCCPGLPCVTPPGSSVGSCGGGGTSGGGDGGTSGGGDGGTSGGGDAGSLPTCALYGQSCAVASDCCDGLPCTNNRCLYPIK